MHFLLHLILFTLVLAVVVFLLSLLLRCRSLRSTYPTATLIITQSPGNQSPRALAHAQAILASNLTSVVIFVSEPPSPVTQPNLIFIPIHQVRTTSSRRTPLLLLRKLIHYASSLLTALRTVASHHLSIRHVLLNTPPVLPTLPLLLLLRPLLFPLAALTLDLHNLAFTLMRLTSPRPVVMLAALCEALSLRLVPNIWTVSTALSTYLRNELHVPSVVLRDRPLPLFSQARESPSSFHVLSTFQQHATVIAPSGHALLTDTAFKLTRPAAFIVAPSSWTPDEDFSPLFTALSTLDTRARPIIAVLTGRGPLRSAFEGRVRAAGFKHVVVVFAFLPQLDYAALLATADAGICMHASSSGLDLPMKAVDMAGAGLPALARQYSCISELVQHACTGFLWESEYELTELIDRLLFSEPGRKELQTVREEVMRRARKADREAAGRGQWQLEWEQRALPTLRGGTAKKT